MKRKLLTLIILLATVFGIVAVSNINTKEAEAAETKRIYFKPDSIWTQANAKFVVYSWGNGDSFTQMTQISNSGVYKCDINSTHTKVIFMRFDPNATEIKFDKQWNKSGDITLPTNGDNYFKKGDGWYDGWTNTTNGNSWSKYERPKYYLVGDFNNWNPADANYLMNDDDDNYEYEISLPLSGNAIGFKITTGGWNGALGNGGKISDATSGVTLNTNTGDDSNCILNATGGLYTFKFNVSTKKLVVSYVSYATFKTQLDSLLKKYYNDGTYTRETDIYVDAAKVSEDPSTYVHGVKDKVANLKAHRITKFCGDYLYFTDSNKGYGTSGDKLTSITVDVNGAISKESINDSLPGMETYYCTLDDFIKGTHNSAHSSNVDLDLSTGWTCLNGVYTNTSSNVLDAFRLFTAPTWLGKTAEGANYIDFSQVTIEETAEGLVMTLWASKTEYQGKMLANAKVVGNNVVFSQAVITK